MSAQTRSEIAELLEAHGLTPTHRLGQHFLADANITRKIVETASIGSDDYVVEIGAGTGTLTSALYDTGARVVSYEIDTNLEPLLRSIPGAGAVEFRFEDAGKVDFSAALDGAPWVMVANLPYNVGTPLVMDALRSATQIERFVVMVQLEVAERFAAEVGSPNYGLPSVVAGLYSQARLAFRVPPQVFYPQPNVESAVVVLERKPAAELAETAVALARAGFGQRRKMLRQSLKSALEDPVRVLAKAGLAETGRAEELSPEDYLALAAAV